MRKRKLLANLPKVEVIREHLDLFYYFMAERQAIWYRRTVLRKPPPWTKDHILRDYNFTNVYRELDRGTLWYLENVTRLARDPQHLLWCTIVYRLINRVATFEKVGFPSLRSYEKTSYGWYTALKHIQRKEPVFTAAHLTLPSHELGSTKIGMLKKVLDGAHKNFDKIFKEVKAAKSLEEVFNTLRQIRCVGPFISYEICCDLMYVKLIPFNENDWVNPGPGCKLGIRLIFPLTKKTEGFQERMEQLRNEQVRHFGRLGLTFQYLNKDRLLTLRSIEHSLCEFGKYYRLRLKVRSGKRRLFKPRDWPDSQGQLPMRFSREEESCS